MDKNAAKIFSDAYLDDSLKNEVRKWKGLYLDATKVERKKLRKKHPEQVDIFDYCEQTFIKK